MRYLPVIFVYHYAVFTCDGCIPLCGIYLSCAMNCIIVMNYVMNIVICYEYVMNN